MISYKNKEQRAFWAMNFNMAANNIFSAVQYLDYRTVQEEIGNLEDKGFETIQSSALHKVLSSKKGNVVKQDQLIKKLCKIFPFLSEIRNYRDEYLMRVEKRSLSAADLYEIFLFYAKFIIDCRNYFSHARHDEPVFDPEDTHRQRDCVVHVYDALVNIMKRRFCTEADEDSFIRKNFRRFDGVDKEKKAKENKSWKLRLFVKVAGEDQRKGPLSDAGLALIASFFIEKKYASQMVDQVICNIEGDPLLAAKRIYLIYAANPPRPRLECGDLLTPQTLGMDILNHLHKVPYELFEMMSSEKQKEFRFRSDDGLTENLMRRAHADRFPFLAMSCMDLTEKLSRLRFMVDLGMYYFDCYSKANLIDGGTLEDRRLGRRLFAFDRIQNARKKWLKERESTGGQESLYWRPKMEQSPPAIYRIDMAPRYYIKENTVGLAFASGKNYPDINGKNTRNPSPQCWLSVYELPMMLFLVSVETPREGGKKSRVEELIEQYCEGWNRLLNDIADEKSIISDAEAFRREYGLKQRDLPGDLARYVQTGKLEPKYASPEARVKARAADMAERAQRMLNSFCDEIKTKFKPGKDRRRRFTAGRLAMVLTRELVQYQPSNAQKPHTGKVTSPNFMVLQASLARFDERKNSLEGIFKKSGLINNPAYPHPFLYKLLSQRNAMDSLPAFFEAYLKQKIVYLRHAAENGGKNEHIFRRYYEQKKRAGGSDEAARYASHLRRCGFCLPRNLFAGLIEETVRSAYPDAWRRETDEAKRKNRKLNSSYLMSLYHQQKDGFQWFYQDQCRCPSKTKEYKDLFAVAGPQPLKNQNSSRRTIETIDLPSLFKTIQKPNNPKQLAQKRLSLIRKLEALDTAEKHIRFSRTQDIALLEGAKNLLSDLNRESLRLNRIERGNPLLNQTEPFALSIQISRRVGQDTALAEFKIKSEMKLKNFGNYQRVLSDLRTRSLLQLLYLTKGKTEISLDELEHEYQCYDAVRKEIFSLVFSLETKVLSSSDALAQNSSSEGARVKFSDFVEQLELEEPKQWAIVMIRNAFAHHYYPDFVVPTDIEVNVREELKHMTLDRFDPEEPSLAKNLLTIAKQLFAEAQETPIKASFS